MFHPPKNYQEHYQAVNNKCNSLESIIIKMLPALNEALVLMPTPTGVQSEIRKFIPGFVSCTEKNIESANKTPSYLLKEYIKKISITLTSLQKFKSELYKLSLNEAIASMQTFLATIDTLLADIKLPNGLTSVANYHILFAHHQTLFTIVQDLTAELRRALPILQDIAGLENPDQPLLNDLASPTKNGCCTIL